MDKHKINIYIFGLKVVKAVLYIKEFSFWYKVIQARSLLHWSPAGEFLAFIHQSPSSQHGMAWHDWRKPPTLDLFLGKEKVECIPNVLTFLGCCQCTGFCLESKHWQQWDVRLGGRWEQRQSIHGLVQHQTLQYHRQTLDGTPVPQFSTALEKQCRQTQGSDLE